MTATWTLTGKISSDYTGEPKRGLALVITTQSDPEVYADSEGDRLLRAPKASTNDSGYICERFDDGSLGLPGIELLVGVTYRIRSVPASYMPSVVFQTYAAGVHRDIADIIAGVDSVGGLLPSLLPDGLYTTDGLTLQPDGLYNTGPLTVGSDGLYLIGA